MALEQERYPADLGYVADSEEPNVITAAETLTGAELLHAVHLAAGNYTVTLPPLALWKNKEMMFYVPVDGGGEVTINTSAGADAIGDNLGAVGDYAIIRNIAGFTLAVIKEVTS